MEAQDYEDAYDDEDDDAEEPLKTERLDEAVDTDASERHAQDHSDAHHRTSDGEVESEGAADAGLQNHCWQTARSLSGNATLASFQPAMKATQSGNALPIRKQKLAKDQQQIQSLTKQVQQYKKANAELHRQLQMFYKNEAIAQLENKNKEKQLQLDELLHENRILSHQQRLLQKQIEELQDAKVYLFDFDDALFSLLCLLLLAATVLCVEQLSAEEIRVARGASCLQRKNSTLQRQAKGNGREGVQVASEDSGSRRENKMLAEKTKDLEQNTAPSSPSSVSTSPLPPPFPAASSQDVEATIASQEDEITRLQQRAALMKETQRPDKIKHEKQIKVGQDELEQSRTQLETFYQQLFAKKKTIRSLFLQMKKLKRAVQDSVNAQQTNHHMQQLIFGRELRFSHRSPNHHIPHQRYGGSGSTGHLLHPSSSNQTISAIRPKRAAVERIRDTLKQLGYVPTFKTTRDLGKVEKSSDHAGADPVEKHAGFNGGGGRIEGGKQCEEEEEGEELPPNCVQGRLIPCPPPSSSDRKVFRGGARSQLYAPPLSRKSSPASAEDTAFAFEGSPRSPIAHGSEDGRTFGNDALSQEFGVAAFESDDDEAQEDDEDEAEQRVLIDECILLSGSDGDEDGKQGVV